MVLKVFEDFHEEQEHEDPPLSTSTRTLKQSIQQCESQHNTDPKWFIHPTHYSLLDELEIYPRVYIGGQYEAKDSEWFARHRISHVLNVSSLQNTFQKKTLYYREEEEEAISPKTSSFDVENIHPNIKEDPKTLEKTTTLKQSLHPLGKPMTITYLKINVDDSTDVKIARHFDKAISFVRKTLEENSQNRVLIHCKEGKSRSVTMMLAFGMNYFNLSLLEAFRHFENKTNNRSRINLGFQLQLMNYEKELLEEKGIENPRNSLDFLNSYQMSTCRRVSQVTPETGTATTNIHSTSVSSSPSKLKTTTWTKTSDRQALRPIALENGRHLPSSPSSLTVQQQETEFRSPIKAIRKVNPSSLSSTMSTLTTTSSPLLATPSLPKSHHSTTLKTPKNKLPPTPLAIATKLQEGNATTLIGDDYHSLEFKFDEEEDSKEQDVEISDAMEERVFMTTPAKKRKSDQQVNELSSERRRWMEQNLIKNEKSSFTTTQNSVQETDVSQSSTLSQIPHVELENLSFTF
ncbi:hypothetical protein FDP41_005300 [Naegleria fowleri]|uniref:protein-tyrosine-phosphatase n=1 Tax=Naegleria fowleri TaxID=5763 RepID=A0A6A5BDL0_NAEFO|nr:uncharacterized protein FDP41_005300 [Naegleria fowleri]KAF0975973.1 hypothetical protein FDP41_005300 [Naegleria fowleri]